MKRQQNLIVAGVIIATSVCNAAMVHADQRPEANGEAKRPATKPSIVKTWREEWRSRMQDMTSFSRYIRGEGPARYY